MISQAVSDCSPNAALSAVKVVAAGQGPESSKSAEASNLVTVNVVGY